MRRLIALAIALLAFDVLAAVPILRIAGPINPGTGAYLKWGLGEAAKRGAPFVVLHLSGDGGLLPATREAVEDILDSSVPVVAYVGPNGTRAGSLAALLLAASDVSAMAPQGALGGDPPDSNDEYRNARMRFEAELGDLADHVARARARNAHGAAKMVRGKDAMTGEAALREGILDLTAENESALFTRLSGWKLRVPKGGVSLLPGEGIEPYDLPPTPWQSFLSLVSDSRLAYGLLFLSAVLWALALARPGTGVPSVLGGLCFLTSLFLFYWLPISYGALALLLLGLLGIVAEGRYPAYGLFGLSGLGAFVAGSLWLVDTAAPDYQLPLGWILACAAIAAAIGFALSYGVFRGRRRGKRTGLEALVGEFGETKGPVTPSKGKVFVQGELWSAVSDTAEEIAEGVLVIVTGVKGMALVVKPR